MHSAGTTLDGSWDEVMGLIGRCHVMLHEKGVVRIQTDVRVGTRYVILCFVLLCCVVLFNGSGAGVLGVWMGWLALQVVGKGWVFGVLCFASTVGVYLAGWMDVEGVCMFLLYLPIFLFMRLFIYFMPTPPSSAPISLPYHRTNNPPLRRTDKSQTPADKVRVVEELLAADDNNKEEEPGMRHTSNTTKAAPNATTQPAEISGVVRD